MDGQTVSIRFVTGTTATKNHHRSNTRSWACSSSSPTRASSAGSQVGPSVRPCSRRCTFDDEWTHQYSIQSTPQYSKTNQSPSPLPPGFVLLRTGQALPCVLAHAFCNLMGLPNLAPLLAPPRVLVTPATVTLYRHRVIFLGIYALGIALFALTLFPWTDPALFVEAGRPPLFWGVAAAKG